MAHTEHYMGKREINVEINYKDITRNNIQVTGGAMANVLMGAYGKQKVILKRPTTRDGYYQKNDFENELGHLLAIRHKNVVAVHGITQFPDIEGWWLVLEFCEKGNLSDILGIEKQEKPVVDIERKFQFAVDIASGMNICHLSVPPILHRDLKNPNIFVNAEWVCKVGDFGLSKNLAHRNEKVELSAIGAAGSSQYYPPEILRGEFLDRTARKQANLMAKTDVWPFGLMMWEIFTQEKAWEDFVKEIKGNPKIFSDELCNKKRLPPMEGKPIPKQIKPIIAACLATLPDDRPSFSELVDHLIDASITYFLEIDPHAVQFWRTNKGSWDAYNKAEWKKFKSALSNYLNLTEAQIGETVTWDLLQKRLEVNGHVTLSSFERVLYWFGPLKSNDGDNLFSRVSKFFKKPGFFFHMVLSGEAADAMVEKQERGTFLMRLNEGGKVPIKEAPWTLTIKGRKHVKHIRVGLEANGVISLKSEDFPLKNANITSLFQLLTDLKSEHPKDLCVPLEVTVNY